MRSQQILHSGLGFLGLGFSAVAAYFAFSLSVHHLRGAQTCPIVLDLPACVIVFLCYVLITIAWGMTLAKKQSIWQHRIFAIGFLPAFILAFIGSTGEVFGFARCPLTETGFPKCFLSLALLLALALGWIASNSLQKKTSANA